MSSVRWADELYLRAPPPALQDRRLIEALGVVERHVAARLAHQRTPAVPFIADVDRARVIEQAIFEDRWKERTASFTTDPDWGVLISFCGREDYRAPISESGAREMLALDVAMLVQDPYGVADPDALLVELHAALGAWHGVVGPFTDAMSTAYPVDLRARLVPQRLGWLNSWSDPSCALLDFPHRAGDERWLGNARRLPGDDGWLLRLTEAPLDLNMPEHVEAARLASERFRLIHEVHPPMRPRRRAAQS